MCVFPVNAQEVERTEDTMEAEVVEILEEKEIEVMGETQLYQKLKLTVTNGLLKDRVIEIENGDVPVVNQVTYQKGDAVIVQKSEGVDGSELYFISDFVRRDPIYALFLVFVVLALLIAKKRGFTSLLGMAVSFLIIFTLILPQISKGTNPVLMAILGSLLIIPVTFFLSHGVSRKTTTAIAGTLVSLVVTGILASVFVSEANLSGFASEEAGFLQVATGGTINIKGLLLAGIIIGALGVLDDITIAQASLVYELKKTNKKLNFDKLYQQAMKVGQDHIASMVNTLILVYTGASLPLLLLFIDSPRPFSEVINYEIIAGEIIQMLVGSIGLIIAVPVTTFLACFVAENE